MKPKAETEHDEGNILFISHSFFFISFSWLNKIVSGLLEYIEDMIGSNRLVADIEETNKEVRHAHKFGNL